MTKRFRYFGPEKHGSLGRFHTPAYPVQSFTEHITALAIDICNFPHAVFRTIQRHGGGDLNGLKDTIAKV